MGGSVEMLVWEQVRGGGEGGWRRDLKVLASEPQVFAILQRGV